MTYFDKVRQHSFPAPSRVSKIFPGVEVIRATPIPAHSVQNAATAKDLTLWHRTGVPIQLCLWHRGEVPIVDAANIRSHIDRVLYDCLIVIPITLGFSTDLEA